MKLRVVNGLSTIDTSLKDAIVFCNRRGGSLSIHICSEKDEHLSIESIIKAIAGDTIVNIWTPAFVMSHGDCSEEVAIEALKLMQEEYDVEVGYHIDAMYCAVNQCNTPEAVTKRHLISLGHSSELISNLLNKLVEEVTEDDLKDMVTASFSRVANKN